MADEYATAVAERVLMNHMKHVKAFSEICDVLEKHNVPPEDGQVLLCALAGFSIAIDQERVLTRKEIQHHLDYIGAGMIMVDVFK